MRESDPRWQRFLGRYRGFQQLCRKAGFDENQPRVPAGNPDGGQWSDSGSTSGGSASGGITDRRILSDTTPDNNWKPGARYAENQHGYPVDLKNNAHVMQQHVKSPDYVLRRVREIADDIRGTDRDFEGLKAGSFVSLEAANKLVNSTLAQYQYKVDQVASGLLFEVTIESRFSTPTGYEAYVKNRYSQAILRDTYGVRVVLRHNSASAAGYEIVTAFPVR